jgi:hypothetical protein
MFSGNKPPSHVERCLSISLSENMEKGHGKEERMKGKGRKRKFKIKGETWVRQMQGGRRNKGNKCIRNISFGSGFVEENTLER